MSAIELTAYPGKILGPIAKVLGWIMNGIYNIVYNLFGVESVTVSIVIITILIYTCLLPLTIKQQKFSKLSQKMQPELKAIQDKYKNRKDQSSLPAYQRNQTPDQCRDHRKNEGWGDPCQYLQRWSDPHR